MKKLDIVHIIGAARSGTTLLGSLFNDIQGVCYLGERDYHWRRGKHLSKSDLRTEMQVTPRDIKRWRKSYRRLHEKTGDCCLVEKTPSNALRIPVVARVSPEAKFVHVVRDGRDVARSAAEEWRGHGASALDSRKTRTAPLASRILRIIQAEARVGDRFQSVHDLGGIPFALIRGAQSIIRHTLHPSNIPWGPRVPALREWRAAYELEEACALQWGQTVQIAEASLAMLPPSIWIRVRFERLIEAPIEEASRLLEFLKLDVDPEVLARWAKSVAARPQVHERQLDNSGASARHVEALIRPQLQFLGYSERTS